MKFARVSGAVWLVLAIGTPCAADPAPAIHYAPSENLERIDVGLIDSARREIDMAAYVLTEWPLIEALTRAANRGVRVRIILDGAQLAQREETAPFQDLAGTPDMQIRVKPPN
jgi:phosphatidylserine/phosphatidylglycerophosphate/cardiolipin synthase-like enzyme